MKNHTAQAVYGTIGAVTFGLAMNATTVQAQIIATPTGDPGATGTIVIPVNAQIDITGGTQAGSALFHSFTQFDVSQGQTANFQTPADIQNVLTRVTNGVPSTIDGTLQLSGAKANLYFMNPAGIVFGPNANFNLPASFVGTTAKSISFASGYFEPPFSATGENAYESISIRDNEPAFKLKFPNIENSGSIINFGNLSVPNDLILIGGAVGIATDISGPRNLVLGTAVGPIEWIIRPSGANRMPASMQLFGQPSQFNESSLYATTENAVAFPQVQVGNSTIPLKAGDLITQNISTLERVQLYGDKVKAGNVQSEAIDIGGSTVILAGHLSTLIADAENSGIRSIFGFMGVSLTGPEIRVSSIVAKAGTTSRGDNVGGNIVVTTSGIFQVTDSIPETTNLGRIKTDITKFNSSESPVSIIADGFIRIRQTGTKLAEGTSLERDQSGYAVYRLVSNPDTIVDIIAINPTDGSLILKSRSTGEIIVGDKVVVQSNNTPMPTNISAFKGLIVGRDPRNGSSLSELSGAIKRGDSNNAKISILDARDAFLYDISGTRTSDLNSANPIGGALPGSYGYNSGYLMTGPLPLPADIQAAIDQHNQKTTVVATPAPTLTPMTSGRSETITPTPEAPAAPKFDQSSIVNSTIDPTDTINLSAGAIRGAAINPGGLLKVELDTRNPEGVLTRKVTTK